MIDLPIYEGARYSIGRSNLVLLDCLPETERSIRLPDDIEDIVNAKSIPETVKVHRAVCKSADDLKNELNSLFRELQNISSGTGLIIQLEAHGSDFKDNPFDVGLEVGDKREFEYWRDLQPFLSNLYEVTRGNLLLNVSACWGYSGLASVEGSLANGCAPFRYLLSPTTEISAGDLHDFWLRLYRSIYNDLDLGECLKSDERFFLLSIEEFIDRYVLVEGNEITDADAQEILVRESKIFISQDQVAKDRELHAQEIMRDYLLLEKFPDLYTEMDLMRIARKLNDHEMLLATTRDLWGGEDG